MKPPGDELAKVLQSPQSGMGDRVLFVLAGGGPSGDGFP